jgi:hypothetical protein
MLWMAPKGAFRAGSVTGTQWNAANLGTWSFAGGYNTQASGLLSTAFGSSTEASGVGSTAAGMYSKATGTASIAMGNYVTAPGNSAAAMGENTTARAFASTALGMWNDSLAASSPTAWVDTDPLFYVGNGTSATARNNALLITKGGQLLARHPNTIAFDPLGPPPSPGPAAPASGAGTRLMWMPARSAFRVGTVTGTQWDNDSIGHWSFATGMDAVAKGNFSVAIGKDASSRGSESVAIGSAAEANGSKGMAFGVGARAAGSHSIAVGYFAESFGLTALAIGNNLTASGYNSIALGSASQTSNDHATALGRECTASGYMSTAIGAITKARGSFSMGLGYQNLASGNYSTALGFQTTARAAGSTALGTFNDSVASSNPTTKISTDPLLYVGNGTDIARHNALVVYHNGSIIAKNPTTVTTAPAAFSVPISGAGTRMMWLPEKGAFRSGTVTGNHWNADSIGLLSFAAGHAVKARGNYSTAIGNGASAIGHGSTALGTSALAQGENSTALGYASYALGSRSTALGEFTSAIGSSSTAMGDNAIAVGDVSVAAGREVVAQAYASTALGQFNDTSATENPFAWVASDPLLYVGNGTSSIGRSNAMVLYKNGNATLDGSLTVEDNKGLIRSSTSTQLKYVATSVTVNPGLLAAFGTTTMNVTFTQSFSSPPQVYVGNVTGGAGGWAEVQLTPASVTSTGCTLFIHSTHNVASSPNFSVQIMAIGAQ